MECEPKQIALARIPNAPQQRSFTTPIMGGAPQPPEARCGDERFREGAKPTVANV
jgi:hypothetical protein